MTPLLEDNSDLAALAAVGRDLLTAFPVTPGACVRIEKVDNAGLVYRLVAPR